MILQDVPPAVQRVVQTRIMDVEYAHLSLAGGDDLYLTDHGRAFVEHLLPENFWSDKAWFGAHHERLRGSSTLYRIRTKPVGGRGKDIVLKWNRMGQDVPGTTAGDDLAGAEFNSPFEEFSLATELRQTRGESPGQVLTHKPLAIYVPAGRVEMERLGRRRYKLEAMQDAHKDVRLDIFRNYAVIYEWVKGIDAAEALHRGLLGEGELGDLVERAKREMHRKGFRVRDNKAQHLIVRRRGRGGLARRRDGRVIFATIDFELLERTAQRERFVRAAKRRTYLQRQARRFQVEAACPPHLARVRILGVDYIHGRVGSTDGALWVVGKDPALFDYFLPVKWRKTPRTRLSVIHEIYETITKDNIHLVWKVSRVGQQPDADPFKTGEKRMLAHGYNSPFEEVSLSLSLGRAGIDSTYPRAIYMTGSRSQVSTLLADERRYRTHEALRAPDGRGILRRAHDYILLWGYWNGPDELLAENDREYCRGISALHAYHTSLVSERTYLALMEKTRSHLAAAGVEDLNLRGTHLLLSLAPEGRLLRDCDGLPAVRICNFELLRRTDAAEAAGPETTGGST